MTREQSLVHLNAARQAIVKARSIDEVKAIRDKAEALRGYAQTRGLSLEIQNHAAEIKLRAERRAGELLAKMEMHGGDRRSRSRSSPATLKALGITKGNSSRWQTVASVPEETFERHITKVRAKKEEITTAGVIRLVRGASAVWNTPSEIIEAARAVLGGIDLDPASNATANKQTVRAKDFYTEKRDGLDPKNKWWGRVWMNPPYLGLAGPFAARLLHEYCEGNVKAAIALFNIDSVTAEWFRPLWNYPLCFVLGRPEFNLPDGTSSGTRIGFVLVYLGPDVRPFIDEFAIYGPAARRRKTSNLLGKTTRGAWCGGYMAVQTDLTLPESIQKHPDPVYEAFQSAQLPEARDDDDMTEEDRANEIERMALEREEEAQAVRPWREYLRKRREEGTTDPEEAAC